MFVVIVFGLSLLFVTSIILSIVLVTSFRYLKLHFIQMLINLQIQRRVLSNMKLINNAIKVEAIIDTNKLDFNNHTYLFVFGAPIKKCTIVLRLHYLTINLRVTQRL